MKITKVEEVKDGDGNLAYHKVHIEHCGMDAYYILEESLRDIITFNEEMKLFKRTFFSGEEVDWSDVMDNEDVYGFFQHDDMIRNELADKIMCLMDIPECLSFEDAYIKVKNEVQ